MADDDASRRPPQADATASPAEVGTTTTNQVSAGTLQEILDTGDQSLIDQAFDQLTADDLTAYLESLPSPTAYGRVSPAGVGSQASRTPSTRSPSTLSVRTPTPSPSPRTQRRQLRRRILAAAGAGGGGDSSGGSGGRGGRSTPRGKPGRGRRPRGRPQPSPSLPWTPPRPSRQATLRGSPRTLNHADLQRRLRMFLQDQEQFAQGREIANITTTNSIVTSYKQGGRPTVQSNSSRFST